MCPFRYVLLKRFIDFAVAVKRSIDTLQGLHDPFSLLACHDPCIYKDNDRLKGGTEVYYNSEPQLNRMLQIVQNKAA